MYKENQIVNVKVVNIVSYGAFCEMENGGIGLIHISEISDYFVKNIEEYIKIGDKFEAKIIEYNKQKNQVCLSYKSLRPKLLKQNVEKN